MWCSGDYIRSYDALYLAPHLALHLTHTGIANVVLASIADCTSTGLSQVDCGRHVSNVEYVHVYLGIIEWSVIVSNVTRMRERQWDTAYGCHKYSLASC